MEKKESGKGYLKKLFEKRETMLALIVIVLFVVLSITNSNFLKWSNLKVIISSLSVDGIIVIGMTIILISGGIDLSVGSTMCLAMTVAALGVKSGINPWIASLIGIAAAGCFGILLGLLVTKLHLTHFIVSLCFMGIARGLVYILTSGSPISLVQELKEHASFAFLGQGTIGTFPMAPVCFIIIAVISGIYVKKSSGMRKVFYTGSNENAARYSGVKTDKIKILACIACAVLAGIAGIIYMIRYSGVAVSAGQGGEMVALSAAVIGGASMNGGKGSVMGSVLGLVFIVLIQDALTLMMVPSYWQDFVKYMIVLLAVCLDGISLNRSFAASNK
ncbi:MAG: ABC transporter permease [Lachnospiraceae bacterium]|uniref:ABC transporter permease n=1 Tax=Bariatricus sp. SGI.019 TaxID=3420548 RepID=UPI002A8D6F15|nr:ABC transporter permease [Lachnospiraceae bacterium]